MPVRGRTEALACCPTSPVRRVMLAALVALMVAAAGCAGWTEPPVAAPAPPAPAPPPLSPPPPPAAAPAPRAAPAPVQPPPPAPVSEKLTYAADVFFDAGRASLRPEAEATLDAFIGKAAGINLEIVVVAGHADAREAGGAAAQKPLSEQRAAAVKAFLVRRGVEPGRVYAEGRGASQPVADSRTPDGRAKNRRAEVEVLGTRVSKTDGGAAKPTAPCPTDKMAKFPWPNPPQPTITDTLVRSLLLGTTLAKTATMRDVSDRLESAVRAAGYRNPKLLGVGCDGFAMVLDLERIRGDGSRLAGDRGWAPPSQDDSFSLASAIKRLFYAPPGRYRQVVLVVSDRPMGRTTPAPSAAQFGQITKDAGYPLPGPFDAVPMTDTHVVRALVYEFEKPAAAAKDAAVVLPPGSVGLLNHLEKARLIPKTLAR